MSTSSPPAVQRARAMLDSRSKALVALVVKYFKFVGPGAMVSVAYMDPGNYATDIAAGASYRFQLLFIVLWSNFVAILLQTLSIKLGSVTGMNLAQMIKAHCHPYLNIFFYIIAEIAIIATDMAEVIGTAIALDLLFNIPLVAGCIISIADVLLILLFYSPGNNMRALRVFEMFVFALVLGVVACFCYQLSLISGVSAGAVLKGYLPNSAILQKSGIYQACGILGATVMPHSLYLGSGTIQPRLLSYDQDHGLAPKSTVVSFEPAAKKPASSITSDVDPSPSPSTPSGLYLPSLRAIRHGMKMSIVELTISLLTFALFVNSAILIIAGASLYFPPGSSASDNAVNASLFGIYDLLAQSTGPAAAKLFAAALLLSGISAGIVCTIAGQIISEGQVRWNIKPWQRRLLTRSIAITPAIIIAGAVGKQGISTALEASQVVLCFCLPVVTAPLIWFTAKAKYQRVQVLGSGERLPTTGQMLDLATVASNDDDGDEIVSTAAEIRPSGHERRRSTLAEPKTGAGEATTTAVMAPAATTEDNDAQSTTTVHFHNHWAVTAVALVIWVVILSMNIAAVVMLGLGVGN